MAEIPSSLDVAVVGAGAAGLGAGRRLKELGASFALFEAAHRIGGRGYTEEIAPGVAFDLGCHWMHSASLNPFVAMAEAAGFT
ncbi:MAG TPA: NAD(P)-binding protein, partial [Nitrospiraceae bacterium]